MSTLTKVLIILLTITSIFLCGIVVTYVANADNYKQKYDTLNQNYRAAKENEDNANRRFNELQKQKEDEKLKLGTEIAALKKQIVSLEANLKKSELAREDALQRVNNWASIVKDFTETYDKQEVQLQKTLADLNSAQTTLIEEQAQHKETTTALMEQMAIVKQLEAESKRLVEEKADLQKKLDQLLQQYGKTAVPTEPVTPIEDKAQVAPATKDIDLKGRITEVNLETSLAAISIGKADGVEEKMRFHVTRGDTFICDIVILDVQPDKAVGFLDLVEQEPKVGDNVSTNL